MSLRGSRRKSRRQLTEPAACLQALTCIPSYAPPARPALQQRSLLALAVGQAELAGFGASSATPSSRIAYRDPSALELEAPSTRIRRAPRRSARREDSMWYAIDAMWPGIFLFLNVLPGSARRSTDRPMRYRDTWWRASAEIPALDAARKALPTEVPVIDKLAHEWSAESRPDRISASSDTRNSVTLAWARPCDRTGPLCLRQIHGLAVPEPSCSRRNRFSRSCGGPALAIASFSTVTGICRRSL